MTSVTSVAVPPVDKLAVERNSTACPASGTESALHIDAFEHFLRLRIELEPGQYFFVTHAAARILVDDLDELLDGVLAVADDMAGRAPGRGDEIAVHHQEAMIVALQEGLDDDRARVFARRRVALRDFFIVGEPDRNAAAMIAVVRFRHDRESDALGGANGLRFALHQFLFGHRQSQGRQDLVGLFLIARQFDRDVRGAAGYRGLNSLLKFAMAQLHQRLIIETQPGNAAMLGGAHQRGGRGSQGPALREANEFIARFLPVPVSGNGVHRPDRGGQQRTQQPQPKIAGRDAFVALRIFVHHGINTRCSGAARLAECDLLAGDILQLNGDVFENMPQPGTLILPHAAKKAAGFAIGTAMLREAWQALR